MARNGSGTYALPAGNPVVTGTTISSTVQNNTMSDIATALTGSVAANGETPITANLPMNSKKITGLADATTAGDAIAYGQASMGPLTPTTVNKITVTAPATGATLTIVEGKTLTFDSGTLTCTLNASGGTPTGTATGTYMRVGNRMYIDIAMACTNWNGATGQVTVNGLPVTAAANGYLAGFITTSSADPNFYGRVTSGGTSITLYRLTGATYTTANATIVWGVALSGWYQV